MSIKKPIKDREELLKLSNIDIENDSEKEIIYKFGKLMGDWSVIEISMLADYIYYELYTIDKSIRRKFSEEFKNYLDTLSDWDYYCSFYGRWRE